MKEQAEKLLAIEIAASKVKGPFELFALFLREDAPDKWDLVISSEWARKNKKDAINYLIGKVREKFSDDELVQLSRIIVLNKDDAALKALHRTMQVEHSISEIRDSNFMGLAIKHAYLITSKRQHS